MKTIALGAAALCLAGSAFAAAGLDSRLASPETGFTLGGSLYRLIGGATEAVGDTLFLKAEFYYHGGVSADYENDDHSREGLVDARGARRAEPTDWIERLNRRVRAHAHYHLKRDEKKEMLPFFALAVRLDPKNVEAVLTSAYWLDREFKKPRDAADVLEKGMRDNPGSWEIPLRLAELRFREKNHAAVERLCREALGRAAGKDAERHHLIDLHFWFAESLHALGRPAEALSAYRSALGFYGDEEKSLLRDRISARVTELAPAAV